MKNGFTLIELLAVIIVLSLLATITLYTTGTIIKDSKKTLSETQKSKLYEAAKMAYMENGYGKEDYMRICVSQLIEGGYIDSQKVIDPVTNKPLNGYVMIYKRGNSIGYEYGDSSAAYYCSSEYLNNLGGEEEVIK